VTWNGAVPKKSNGFYCETAEMKGEVSHSYFKGSDLGRGTEKGT
jgi:hypothetical protein